MLKVLRLWLVRQAGRRSVPSAHVWAAELKKCAKGDVKTLDALRED